MNKEKKNIFLIGFMGAGKSTIARAIKQKLGYPVVEMDERIVKEQGMPISKIFETYGELYFRELETKLIQSLNQQEPTIVSCGGGVAMRQENVDCMRDGGSVVFLTATPQTIYERVKNSTDRPLLNGHMNVAYISELMEVRRPKYEAAADILVATDGKTKEEIRFYMLHQATKRIVASVAKHMNEPLEKYPMNIENLGNTSSASIPLLLDEWNKKGRLNSGDWIILSGFGGGLTYGASLLQW